MAAKNVSIGAEKMKYLDDLLRIYQDEIVAVYAIGITWEQLKEEAKDKCAEDFDGAIIARETFLEELVILKDGGIKIDALEDKLADVDRLMLQYNKVIKEIYGLDVKAFLNVKHKALPKGK